MITATGGRNRSTGRTRVGIELGRVLARLKESNGAAYAALDERSIRGTLGTLSLVEPQRVEVETEQPATPTEGR